MIIVLSFFDVGASDQYHSGAVIPNRCLFYDVEDKSRSTPSRSGGGSDATFEGSRRKCLVLPERRRRGVNAWMRQPCGCTRNGEEVDDAHL